MGISSVLLTLLAWVASIPPGSKALVWDFSIPSASVEALRTQSLLRGLTDQDPNVRFASLERLGPCADLPVLAAVTNALSDPVESVRWRALEVLVHNGFETDQIIPRLIWALRDQDGQVRAVAAMSIAALGRKARIATPELVRILKTDTDGVPRAVGAYALGEIQQQDDEAIAALVHGLMDVDRLVRLASAVALGKLRPRVKSAVDALTLALGDGGKEVRQAATEALGQIGPCAAAAVPQLERLLKDDAWLEACKAAISIWRIDGKDAVAIKRLTKVLKHGDVKARCAAASYLAEMGPRAMKAVPALIASLRDHELDESSVVGSGFPISPSTIASAALQRIVPWLWN